MNATLHFQRGPVVGDGSAASQAGPNTATGLDGAPTWVTDPLEPPLAGMERAVASR